MAENKKSFILYADLIHTVKKMPKEKAGELFLTILQYVNDENPVVDDMLIDLVFEPIKQQFKRDLKKWDEIKEKRSEAGRISALKRAEAKANKYQQVLTSVESAEQTSTNSTVNDNVNVNVNDNVNVINEIYSLYPSKCPIKNTSTGKTTKNKDKIKSLLKSMSADKLTSIINQYIKESTEGKVYFKNFGTLLNNLPDYSEPEKPKEVLYNYHAEGYGMQYRRTKKQMEHDRAICQGRISKITEIKQ